MRRYFAQRAAALAILAVVASPAATQEPPPPSCTTEGHRQFDFWRGDWVVYGPGGDLAGRNRIVADLADCVLREHWRGNGGLEGRSLNVHSPAVDGWHQTWVDSSGGLLRLDGGLEEGRMVMSGREPSRRDPKVTVMHRIAWEPLPRGMVYQRWRGSLDDGGTWDPLFDGLYVPEGADAAIVDAPGQTGRAEVAPGVELHYRVVGEGPVLVVPNGRIADGVAALADGYRLVLYDSRGRGRSTPYTSAMELSLDTELADLAAILDHLRIERTSLLGFSYYGALSALFAAEQPHRVERLVMIGPLAPTAASFAERAAATDPRETDASRHLATLEAAGAAESDPIAHCLAWQRAHAPDLVASPAAWESDLSTCWLPNERPAAFLAWSRALFSTIGDWNWIGQGRRVTVPTLIVHGDADRISPPAGARAWGDAIPGARVVGVPASGHLPLAERPEVALPAIRDFLVGG